MLKVGGRFSGTDFVYACEESEDGVMSYDAVGRSFGARAAQPRHMPTTRLVPKSDRFQLVLMLWAKR